MTWNHRIVRTIEDKKEYFEIAEVFYDSDKNPYAYGQATISADDIEGINKQLDWFNEAKTKAILNYPEDFNGDVNI